MEGLSSWALSISICAVICTIIEMLVSDSKLEKTVRFILGAFMICAILLPIGQLLSDFQYSEFNKEYSWDTAEKFDTQQENIIKSEIETLIVKKLEEKNIYPQKTEINMDIDDNSNISMITATVILDKKYAEKVSVVTDIIESELGLECEIIFE